MNDPVAVFDFANRLYVKLGNLYYLNAGYESRGYELKYLEETSGPLSLAVMGDVYTTDPIPVEGKGVDMSLPEGKYTFEVVEVTETEILVQGWFSRDWIDKVI